VNSPCVSIMLLGSDSDEATRLTLEACLQQTYSNTEVILVSANRQQVNGATMQHVDCAETASLAQRVNLGLRQAGGEYVTWIRAGDRYTLDAIAVLANRLQQEPDCAVVYADFYAMREPHLISFARSVDNAVKLLRRDVVGPCFLFRRNLADKLNFLDEGATLPVYDFWLRTGQTERLLPVRARLMYCWQPNGTPDDCVAERQTRHQWRKSQTLPVRAIGDLVDTEVMEMFAVQPLLKIGRRLKGGQ
jgi:hypothetical protein